MNKQQLSSKDSDGSVALTHMTKQPEQGKRSRSFECEAVAKFQLPENRERYRKGSRSKLKRVHKKCYKVHLQHINKQVTIRKVPPRIFG